MPKTRNGSVIMHRIKRPQEPAAFVQYRLQHPDERNWGVFGSSTAYQTARTDLYMNQKGFCAYCEAHLPWDEELNSPRTSCVRIEHFHAKADPDPHHNWMLDWKNIMIVCMSSGRGDVRHCDARKEDVQNGAFHVDGIPPGYVFEGYILNPYEMPHECLFKFDEKTGELTPDAMTCSRVAVQGNHHATTEILVDRTIRVLNLNSKVLCRQRKAVHWEYEKRRATLRQRATKPLRELIAEEWFGNQRVLEFFTTRRCLLKGKAEPYIHD